MLKRITNSYVFVLPVLLMAALVIFIQSALFIDPSSSLQRAITLDIIITVPFVYFLLIRKKEIPNFTVFTVFIISMILAGFILPENQQAFLSQFKKYVIPIVELGLVSFVLFKVYQFRKSYKLNGETEMDTYDLIKQVCTEILPKGIAAIFATELGVFYYLFFAGNQKEISNNHYTYFKKSGIKSSIYVLIGLLLVEVVVMHLLVGKWNITVAWVLTFLGIYTCLQVIALIRSMNKRLICIDLDSQELKLNYGLFNHAVIDFRNIESIELSGKALPEDKSIIALSPIPMLDSHNIVLHLKENGVLYKMYGLKSDYKAIAIFIDEKDKFYQSIKNVIEGEPAKLNTK